jgi:hypothetical protein
MKAVLFKDSKSLTNCCFAIFSSQNFTPDGRGDDLLQRGDGLLQVTSGAIGNLRTKCSPCKSFGGDAAGYWSR